MPHLSSVTIALTLLAGLFAILLPFVAALVVHRRLHVGWRYFGYGLLTFLIFQMLTRLPAISVVQPLIAPYLRSHPVFLWIWLFVLAFTAGLFEEVGRYFAFRVLLRREAKTWDKAIMLGVGHGTIESVVLVGVGSLVLLVQFVSLAKGGLQDVPAAQRDVLAHQLAVVAGTPAWVALLSAWERLWALLVQIALSVVVLQVFRRGSIAWLGVAIAAHTLVDAAAVFIPQALGPGTLRATLVTEGVIMLFGLLALWVITVFRDRPSQEHAGTQSERAALPSRPSGA